MAYGVWLIAKIAKAICYLLLAILPSAPVFKTASAFFAPACATF